MKTRKLLWTALALAAASTAATAQSNVSLYGLIDLSVGRTQAPGGASSDGIDSGRMTTSYWGARGNEDLGGGLKAVFALESFMRSDTGSAGRFNADTFWARNAFVGLENMGVVKLVVAAPLHFRRLRQRLAPLFEFRGIDQ